MPLSHRRSLHSALLAAPLVFLILAFPAQASSRISFEVGETPAKYRTENGGIALVTTLRFIDGDQSLRWDWISGSSIFFDHPIPYQSEKQVYNELKRPGFSTFSFWVYCEQPYPEGKLRIDFGGSNSSFDFGLNFTGWRTCNVAFDRDMRGRAKPGMHGIRITAPRNYSGGRIYLDGIVPAQAADSRNQWADDQVPFVKGRNSITRTIVPPPPFDPGDALEELTQGLHEVEQRLEEHFLPNPVEVTQDSYDSLRRYFDSCRIQVRGDVLTGSRVLLRKHKGNNSTTSAENPHLREYTEHMLKIAKAYRSLPDDHPALAGLRYMYVLMCRNLLDQGWQHGSALGHTTRIGYESRSWYSAVFLMREVLEAEGILDPVVRSLIWYMRDSVNVAEMRYDHGDGANLDYLNTQALSHLTVIASLPNSASKLGLLKRYGEFISTLLATNTPGTVDGIKEDGTAFHHGGNYPGYSFPAFRSSATVCHLLHGTPFAVSPEALQNLSHALGAAAVYSNPETGIGLCGRHPFGESSVTHLAKAYEQMNQIGVPAPYQPGQVPNGHWSFNYGCFGIHRWDGKMVTLKGYNRYVWSSEIYTADNRYGRYQSNGGVQIYGPSGRASSGFVPEGWDWNRNPGTTAIHRPLNQLESPRPGTLMLRSGVTFSGSSHLKNESGVFAVELEEPDMDRFDPSFRARKSMFCFENRIVCLGAGISNHTKNHPTETTLFQHAWVEGSSKVWMDSDLPVEALPADRRSQPEAASWLIDAHGNGYYVAPGTSVRLSVSEQSSRHNKTKAPNQGPFAAAWIDHGPAPSSASYEYAVVLGANPETMTSFTQEPPYEVIRRGPVAQIVRDTATQTTGYALFALFSDHNDRLLLDTDRPALVMIQELNGSLALSASTGDLNIPDAHQKYTTASPSRPLTLTLLVKGAWRLDGTPENAAASPSGENTRIVLSNVAHATPVQLNLISESSSPALTPEDNP